MAIYRDTRLATERQPPRLFDLTPSIPLKEALEDLAELWSLRIGEQRIVKGTAWAGYTISRPRACSTGLCIPRRSETKP